jgi:hypothetical protein
MRAELAGLLGVEDVEPGVERSSGLQAEEVHYDPAPAIRDPCSDRREHRTDRPAWWPLVAVTAMAGALPVDRAASGSCGIPVGR